MPVKSLISLPKHYKIRVNTYGQAIHLFVGSREELNTFVRTKLKCTEDALGTDSKHMGASQITLEHDEGGHSIVIWLPAMTFSVTEYGLLLHETAHAAIELLKVREMKLGEDSINHAYIYLHEEIFTEFLHRLLKDYNKENPNGKLNVDSEVKNA